MSTTSTPVPVFETGAAVLGAVGNVASWRRPNEPYKTRYYPMVVVQICSDTDEGTHTPAASVTIAGREQLLALRNVIDQALGEGGAA